MRRLLHVCSRTLVINALAAVFVMAAFDTPDWWQSWTAAVRSFGVAFLFSNCIGIPVGVAMPYLVPRVWRRLGFPANWAVIVASLVALAVAGSVLATAILVAVGDLPARRGAEAFAGALRIALLATLTFGLGATVYETMRRRLEAATVALRTKERDEAEARRLAAEGRLSALEARVQPHFLFNTLNSIAALIPTDPSGAERMVGRLSALMRASLDADGSPLIPLGDELHTVRHYLEIERVRFGDRLRFTLPADGACPGVQVPRMALQTLVENSVKYAVSPRREGAQIDVRAACADGGAILTVVDDGPGFDAGRLPAQHGLSLLRDRLAAVFGTRAALRIDSRPGRCAVVLSLPGGERP